MQAVMLAGALCVAAWLMGAQGCPQTGPGAEAVTTCAAGNVGALRVMLAEYPAPDVAPNYTPEAADLPDNVRAEGAADDGAAIELQAMPAFASTHAERHKFHELHYAAILARQWNGQTEVRLPDNTRCDIVTSTHAIEVDWAEKWSEGIGQSLFYGLMLGKRPGLILLVDDPASDQRFIDRAQRVCHERRIWLTTANTHDLDRVTSRRPGVPITLAVATAGDELSIVPAARVGAPSADCGCDLCECKGLCDCKRLVSLVAQPCEGGRCAVPRASGTVYRPASVAAAVVSDAPVVGELVAGEPIRNAGRLLRRAAKRVLQAADRVRPVRRVVRFVFRGRCR